MARVFILSASGAGTSTLGAALAGEMQVPHFDVDKFYWLPTEPPFTTPRPLIDRLIMVENELDAHESWVLEGSILKWGDVLIPRFDLIVFLTVEPSVRMERLRLREQARFENRIEPGGDMAEHSAAFLAWAAAYDTAGLEQRSLIAHEQWLSKIPGPILRLDGAEPLNELCKAVIAAIKN
ncbi:adenylate kinase [Rhizobium hidalgonense]|uniref:adenylate kinase n=1 Tax=Rhizobium hidalgonense TaxID=1538159 RepID=UPI002872811C|nr:adenylate kinase [Rhizobium hidalgonense]MDR9808886.1 adenylate kinase [Rhizobium hidalgonense]